MKTSTYLLLFWCLSLSLCSLSQYKNYSVGLFYGKNDLTNKLNSGGINLQYNTKNSVSFRTGLLVDNNQKVVADNVKTHPVDHYVYNDYKNEISVSHYSIPLLAQVSIGKTVYFTLFGGGLYSGLLKNPYLKTTTYLTDYQTSAYKQQVDYKEGSVAVDYKNELNAYFGAGVCWPMKSGITLNTEVSGIKRLRDIQDDRYSVFGDLRIQIGISYQLNLSKDSKYHFSNYSLKIKKTN